MSKNNHIPEREGRVPPQAVDIEEAVLGAMLIERDARRYAYGEITDDYDIFYKPAHQQIYEVLFDIRDTQPNYDLLLVENELKDRGLLDSVGGSGYLSELTRSVASAAQIEYYIGVLEEKWIKRKIILGNTQLIKEAYDADSDAFKILERQSSLGGDIQRKVFRSKATFVSDLLEETLHDIEKDMEAEDGITGVPSGLAVDKYTAGWQDGDLIVIGARPSVGKTAFMLDGCFNAAMYQNHWRTNVAIVNLDMKNKNMIKRKLSQRARVNAQNIRKGSISEGDFKKLIDAAGELYNTRILLDQANGMHILELKAKAKRWVEEHEIGLLCVDFLQLMSGRREGNREQEISSISRGLKEIAITCNIPVVALSQLSREPLNREGCEPRMSDLRESGSLEQDADVIILLNRPEYFGKTMYRNTSTKGKGWVHVAKHKNGPTGDLVMNFDKQFARWKNQQPIELSDSEDEQTPQPPKPHSIGDYDVAGDEEAPF